MVLGVCSRVLDLPPLLVYQAARIANSILLLVSLYVLISLLVRDKPVRRLAFLFAAIGSGFGWLWLGAQAILGIQGGATVDLREPGAVIFTSIMMSPLYTAAYVLMIFVFIMVVRWQQTLRLVYMVLAGAGALALALVHPYDYITVCAVTACFAGLMVLRGSISLRGGAKALLLLVLISTAPMIYNLHILTTDPVFHQWNSQMFERLGQPLLALLGFGIISLLAFYRYEGIKNLKERDNGYIFVVAWALTSCVLILAPSNIQRRLLLGMQIPLSILAAEAVYSDILPRLAQVGWLARFFGQASVARQQRLTRLLVGALLLLAIPTNLCVLGGIVYRQKVAAEGCLTTDEVQALKWLETKTGRGEVVLASYDIGNYIPRVSGNSTFIGYYHLTANYVKKVARMNQFFKPEANRDERMAFLREYNIRYIYIGEREKRLGQYAYEATSAGAEPRGMAFKGGPQVDLSEEPYLKTVFTNNTVTLFAVND